MNPWAHPSLHPKWHVDRFSRFCTANRCVSHYFTMGHYVFPNKLLLPLGGSGPSSNTWYVGSTRVIKPNGISIGSAVFERIPNAMLYSALFMGKTTPKLPLSWRLHHPAGEGPRHSDRQHAQKLVKIAHVVGKICSRTNRQADTPTCRHTQTRSLQYFAVNSDRI